MYDCCAYRFGQPISVYTALDFAFVVVVIVPLLCQNATAQRVTVRIIGEQSCIVFELQLFSCVHHVVARQVGHGDTHAHGVSNVQGSGQRFLGLKHHYSVGCPRTVDGGCRCVLQNGDGSYALRVQIDDFL